MGPEITLALLLGVCMFLYGLWSILSRVTSRGKRYPPVRSGWIPWLGCAIAFGKAPLLFIQETRDKASTVYTSQLANSPSPNVDFAYTPKNS